MKRLFLQLVASSVLLAGPPVNVRLDFSSLVLQIEGADGGSVCQFHGTDPVKGTLAAARTYATLDGFPNDDSTTEFGKFLDVAFSTRGSQGMGLSQVWSTPCGHQSPAGSLEKNYSAASWTKLDFTPYLSGVLPPERFLGLKDRPVRGHTVAMLQAALKRARAEKQRILLWNDLHTDYPLWMWKDKTRKNPIAEEYWDQAALHVVYYAKYLATVHGIPVHAVSFQNEPDLPSRHGFTPEMLIRISKILRKHLDAAGMPGVRILPYTSVVLGQVHIRYMNKTVDTLERTIALLNGPMAEYQPYVDYLGGHMSHSEAPALGRVPNVRFWRASGDFDNHYKPEGSVTFDMGADDQIDEVIRLNTWLYGKGTGLMGIWQIALRMGHTVDNFVMPAKFDIDKDFRHQAIDGSATVYPYVRPGMFLVGGSQGNEARAAYSVDGFGGRGHREVAVITNSVEPREFRVEFANAPNAKAVDVYQAKAHTRKRLAGRMRLINGSVTVAAPADSVTSLVAVTASTKPLAVFVVKDAARLSQEEHKIATHLKRHYEVMVLAQSLSQADQNRLTTKRHPVDPMGTAVYVLSSSIDDPAVVAAHRYIMAPVVAVGGKNAAILGLKAGGRVVGGAALQVRDELDPPASMLENGVPKACGARAAWSSDSGMDRLSEQIAWAGGE